MHSQRLYVESQVRLTKRLQKCLENRVRCKLSKQRLCHLGAIQSEVQFVTRCRARE